MTEPDTAAVDPLGANEPDPDVVEAWAAAVGVLSETLAGMVAGGVLTLGSRTTAEERVTVAGLPDGRLMAEAAGAADGPLSGWGPVSAPRGRQHDLAEQLAEALRTRLGAALPRDVVLLAEDTTVPGALTGLVDGGTLGSDVGELPLMERARLGVAAAIGKDPDAIAVDEDGDIPVRSGSAVVFVRAVDDPPVVRIFAPVVADVPVSSALLERLNELNGRHLLVRTAWREGTIVLDIPLVGEGLLPEQVTIALGVMAEFADEVDDLLVEEFGGRRFMDDGGAKQSLEDTRLGGYI